MEEVDLSLGGGKSYNLKKIVTFLLFLIRELSLWIKVPVVRSTIRMTRSIEQRNDYNRNQTGRKGFLGIKGIQQY